MNLNVLDKVLAQDLSKQMFKTVEIYDVDAINANIENLIMTAVGERLFNINRGTSLYYRLFEVGDDELDSALDDLAKKIKQYVPQVIVLEQNMSISITDEGDTVNILIPYIVRSYNTTHTFKKTFSK